MFSRQGSKEDPVWFYTSLDGLNIGPFNSLLYCLLDMSKTASCASWQLELIEELEARDRERENLEAEVRQVESDSYTWKNLLESAEEKVQTATQCIDEAQETLAKEINLYSKAAAQVLKLEAKLAQIRRIVT